MRDEVTEFAGLSIIQIAAILVLGGAFIAVVLLGVSKIKSAAGQAFDKADAAMDYTYTQYEGDIISGAEVINLITSEAKSDIFIKVNNGVSSVTYIYS